MTVRVDTFPSGTTRPPFLDHLSRAVYARRLGMYTTFGCAVSTTSGNVCYTLGVVHLCVGSTGSAERLISAATGCTSGNCLDLVARTAVVIQMNLEFSCR